MPQINQQETGYQTYSFTDWQPQAQQLYFSPSCEPQQKQKFKSNQGFKSRGSNKRIERNTSTTMLCSSSKNTESTPNEPTARSTRSKSDLFQFYYSISQIYPSTSPNQKYQKNKNIHFRSTASYPSKQNDSQSLRQGIFEKRYGKAIINGRKMKMDFEFDEELKAQVKKIQQFVAEKKLPKIIRKCGEHFDSANYELAKRNKTILGQTKENVQTGEK